MREALQRVGREMTGEQVAFPKTSVELTADVARWKKRAEVAEKKIEDIEEALEKAMCSVVGHYWIDSDRGDYCGRCLENR